MKRYRFNGIITIEYTYHIKDEEIEVEDDEDKDDAIEALCQDLDPSEAFDTDWNVRGLDAEELDENGEDVATRQRKERALLLAWNSGQPIRA